MAKQAERPQLPPWQINPRTWRGPGTPPAPPDAISDALDVIQEATGLPVAHILYWEVCTGWAGDLTPDT